jgi:hypothetical protein
MLFKIRKRFLLLQISFLLGGLVVQASPENSQMLIHGTIDVFDPREPGDCERIKKYLDSKKESYLTAEDKLALEMEVCFAVNKYGRPIATNKLAKVIVHHVKPNLEHQVAIDYFAEKDREFAAKLNQLPDLGSSVKSVYGGAAELRKKTSYMWILGVLGLLGLAALPESVTKWNPEQKDFSKAMEKYHANVQRGPVIDKDNWAVNYIGHPLSGVGYFALARKSGMNLPQSTAYSVFMSTVYWEYGIEAVAEEPSIQDLVLTPGLGVMIGELLYQLTRAAEESDGKWLGSRWLVQALRILEDPFGPLVALLEEKLKKVGIKSVETQTMNIELVDPLTSSVVNVPGFGLRLSF